MTRARKHIVCLATTPYYHVTARCVRRAFLCGEDPVSGNSYEHRRLWVEDRIRTLSSLFAVEICAYAVMSNHYHIVVRLRPQDTELWSDDEVLGRWCALFRGPLLVQRFRAGEALSPAEQRSVSDIAAVYRQRLASLSWFMKCLNEPIARRANAEDGVRGHFWEARFHSQPLQSESAVLSAMAYVDLNPIRAGISDTPESSAYTSVRVRLSDSDRDHLAQAIARMYAAGELFHRDIEPRPLMVFGATRGSAKSDPGDASLSISEKDYIALVELLGRLVATGKRGRIDPKLAPVAERLTLSLSPCGPGQALKRR